MLIQGYLCLRKAEAPLLAVCLPLSALDQVMRTFLSNLPLLSVNQALVHISD